MYRSIPTSVIQGCCYKDATIIQMLTTGLSTSISIQNQHQHQHQHQQYNNLNDSEEHILHYILFINCIDPQMMNV